MDAVSEFMQNTDAFLWAMESDPVLRSTIVTISLLDGTPDWGELVERFDGLSRRLPTFRKRIVSSRRPAPPRWADCPDFDLGFHMRRVTASPPGTVAAVLEMGRLAAMADFDRARPLWEITLIDGLADGGAALMTKMHHSLADGIGGVQIAMTLFDVTGRRGGAPPAVPPPRPPSPLDGLRDTVRYDAGLLARAATASVAGIPGVVRSAARHPVQTATSAAGVASSIYRTVRPITEPGSSLMRDRSTVRRLGIHAVSRPRLRAAAHAGGGSLNDAFLAGLTGALRRYHEQHHAAVGDFHVGMPMSLRAEGDAIGGNRVTIMRFDVPVGLADPARRIEEIHRRATRQRDERSLPYMQLIAGALNLLPRWYIGAALRRVDFVASDVPGIPAPVSLGGAPLRMAYGFGPTIGAAVNVTLLTYMDTCALGINVDAGAIPDFEVFYQCLVDGFDEVLALAD
ncbi:wax ester/triacylglycerol synthase domain-containing protein [Mycobacterium sp. HUMS_1102779]|uniref:wax ester/triacylglycerol synthase domain-containing protein n=1 Tax=Mycobacterium sp. HUMS_1102779 TaxID=3383487 RepID=UPI00389AAE5B